ncbi:MAG TPA: AMP-binding protein [Burkholderiaceae bacterium]|nr:AMP-binding protein [Burkholderiaceae bacterium]
MSTHYDALEARPPAQREAALMAALPAQLAHARAHAPAFAASLAGVDAAAVNSRAALARLPVIRKHELLERQRGADAPDVFGGFSALAWGAAAAEHRALRVFASPGPIYEPEGANPDYWRMARALFAAGLRAGDLVHNSFSYHFTPAGAMMESGAFALGCTVFPGGTGQTEQQVQAMAALKPAAYIGTPSFLKLILDKADELGVALPSLVKASVGGEAFPPSLRDWMLARSIDAYQSYGTADLGLIAYETAAREGLVVDEGVIVEIVRPGTGDVLVDGEVGEVVVTTLNRGYPLIRFGTGDLSAVLPGHCATGRTNTRIKGWMGRADQTAKVRGMFVHPAQVAEIARRFPEVRKARLVVHGEMANDSMELRVEAQGASDGLAERIAQALRDVTKLRGEVLLCAIGALPNDGKVIEDARSHR